MSDPAPTPAVQRSELARLHQLGLLDGAAHAAALALAGLDDQRTHWRRCVDTALAIGGTALVASGIVFFFAYNWAELHRLVRFALLGCGIAGSVSLVLWRGPATTTAQAALLLAAVLAGVLLATFGQAYQTGADPYGLFLAWAIVITPWALAARARLLWLLWLGLANLALALYWIELLSPRFGWLTHTPAEFGAVGWFAYLYLDTALALAATALNVAVLVIHEWTAAASARLHVAGRTVPRAAASLAAVTGCMAVIMAIVDLDTGDPARAAAPVAYVALHAAGIAYYLLRGRDLFILAVLYLDLIVVTAVLLAAVTAFDPGAYLAIAAALCGLAAGAATLLRRHARRFAQSAEDMAGPA